MLDQNTSRLFKISDLKSFEKSLRDDGFSRLDRFFSELEVSTVLAQLDFSTLKRSRAGARHVLSHSAVNAVANDVRMLRLAQLCLSEAALPFRATLFDKSPSSNWLVVWHQDTALRLCERIETEGWGPWSLKEGVLYAHAPARVLERIVAFRLHLDESHESNGPLRVLPRTHTKGVLTDPEIQAWASSVRPVECTVKKGGIVAMRPLVVHSSSKSQSPESRRVLHIEYSASRMTDGQLEIAVA